MSKNPFQKTMVWLLAALLLPLPLSALPNPEVLGRVVGSKEASLGHVTVPNSGTILNNDVLATGAEGKALVDFSSAGRATLLPGTSVRFHRKAGRLVSEISSGAMVVEASQGREPVVATPHFTISPAARGKTVYYVAMMPDRSTVIAAQRGSVVISDSGSGRSYVLPQGKYAAIPAAPAAFPPSHHGLNGAPVGSWHIGRLKHDASIALVAAIVAGTTSAVMIPLVSGGGCDRARQSEDCASASPSAP